MTSIAFIDSQVNLSSDEILSLPGSKVHHKSQNQYVSACPFCNTGKDRFCFWPERGNFWCRTCQAKGFVSDAPETREKPPPKPIVKLEARAKHKEILGRLETKKQADRYHSRLDEYHRDYLQRVYGLTNETINTFNLGYSKACPTCPTSDSISIPYYYTNGRQRLINLRHRLIHPPEKGGKYRPEESGLISTLFNIDVLLDPTEPWVVLVEGEFKAMVLTQFFLPAVGLSGQNAWNDRWARWFSGKDVFVALDPGAEAQARTIGRIISTTANAVYVCNLPYKPDDMLVHLGYSLAAFTVFLEQGRKHPQ